MALTLNIYTDDTLREIKRVAEADKVKIPYRVGINLIESLDTVNISNENDLIKFVSGAAGKLDKVVKATFGVSESELECVDAGELVSVGVELYNWAMEKVKGIKGDDPKN